MSQLPPRYAEVVNRIARKLQEKGGLQKCPTCGANKWVIGQYVTLQVSGQVPSLPNPYGFRPPSTNYPTVAIFCSNCGNTQLVNLLVLGFTEQDLPSLTLPPFGA